jgi:hypothetical protein
LALKDPDERELYRAWFAATKGRGMTSAAVAERMPGVSEAGVRLLWKREPSRLNRDTRSALEAYLATDARGSWGNGARQLRERGPTYNAAQQRLDDGARIWIQRFLLRLTEAGCSDQEVDEARLLLTRSHLTDYLTGGANAEQDLAPDDRLRSLRAVAEHVIIPTLRRRGRKVDASLTR